MRLDVRPHVSDVTSHNVIGEIRLLHLEAWVHGHLLMVHIVSKHVCNIWYNNAMTHL